MTSEIEILRKLAAVDDEIYEKQQMAKKLPDELGKEEKRLGELKKEAELLSEDIKRVHTDASEAELDSKEIEKQIIDYKVKLNAIKTNEEYRLVTSKIKELEEKKSATEEKALEFLTEADSLRERLAEQNRKISDEKTRLEGVKKEVDEKVAALEAEIEELKKERAKFTPELDPENLVKYDRAHRKIGCSVVVAIEENMCSGCHMSVRPNSINLVMAGKIVQCPHCNRIFFLNKESE